MIRLHTVSGVLTAVAIVSALGSVPAAAQVARSGGSEQRVVQQLQQLAQERTALQTESTRLKKELDQAQSDLKAAKADRDALKLRLAKAEAHAGRDNACAAGEQTIQQQRQRMDELVARFRETASTLKEVESDRTHARQELAEKGRAYDTCAQSNVELYGIADAALSRYESYAAGRKELFTRISRTRIENLVDEYRQRAAELKVPAAKPSATEPPATAAH